MTRINGDANEVMGFFIDGLPFVFTHGAYIICSMIIMFTLSWKLALVSVVLVPALFYVGFMMMPTLWHYYGRRHRANRSLNAQINDNLTGARVVKACGLCPVCNGGAAGADGGMDNRLDHAAGQR